MRPTLQLKIGQQLTMTPQLQQAIRLLQLSSLDLQQEIQEALESNPLLEQEEQAESHESLEQIAEKEQIEQQASEEAPQPDTTDQLSQSEMPDELPVDSSWDDVYSAAPNTPSATNIEDDSLYQGETTESLQDYLLWQMELTPMSDQDRAIAHIIIDAVDEAGMLTVSAEDILESLGDEEVELDEIEAVLKRVQLFDPVGVAARSLGECLNIQLRQFAADTPWLKEAAMVINEHSDLLANRDYRTLMRKTRLKEDELAEVLSLIKTLNPRPGNLVMQQESQYVVPDVSVTKKSGQWVVELNPDSVPKVSINQHYASMTKGNRNGNDNQFIRSHLQEAKWFIKSLESRNETLLKVANCIVQQQQAFFEYGDEAMKPMVLNDVAEAVEMHESTISRVTTQKYMHTPRGIYELKYFFSSHVSTENGGECSSTAIRAFIKKLVAAENTKKPLSDSKMADILAEQGIKVARRTVAKYRESLGIAPSNQRKSLL